MTDPPVTQTSQGDLLLCKKSGAPKNCILQFSEIPILKSFNDLFDYLLDLPDLMRSAARTPMTAPISPATMEETPEDANVLP